MRGFDCSGCKRPDVESPEEERERDWLVASMAITHLGEVVADYDLESLREFLRRAMAMEFVTQENGRRSMRVQDAIRIYRRWVGMKVMGVDVWEYRKWHNHYVDIQTAVAESDLVNIDCAAYAETEHLDPEDFADV